MTEGIIDHYAEDILEEQPARKRGLFSPFVIVIILAAGLMLAVIAWGIYQKSLTQIEGGPAPDFTLPLLGGGGNFTLSEHRGEVVVINFWASWCGPCRVEAPLLQRTHELYKDQGVIVLGIAIKDIEGDSLAFMEEFGITYPNVMDLGAHMEEAYRTTGVPETFIVGKDGEVTQFFFAQPGESQLHQAIEEAMNS